MRRRSSALALCLGIFPVALACTPGADDGAGDTGAARSAADTSGTRLAACYRSETSVLLGPSRGGDSEGTPPGWLRIENPTADSGTARLTDSGGAGLNAVWRRVGADSILVTGFDDFLRVEARLRLTDRLAAGTATAHSDATLERDSAGRLQDLRRSWAMSAPAAACDQMPTRSP